MVTKVQTSQKADNATFADFKAWAGDITSAAGTGTGLAAALYTLGFTKLADTYTAKWDNGTTIGAAALPTAAGTLFGSAFPATTTNARAGLTSTHFKGAWVASTSYSIGDVVTDTTTAQIVFICTTATSSATAPVNLAANWSPYWMEIWSTTHVGTVTTVGNASGGNTTYTISPVVNTGVFPVGASITTASCGNAANNGTFTVVSYNSSTGALVLNNPSGVAGSSLSGTATNALTKFYMKVEYGCTATVGNPEIAIQLGNAYSSNTGIIHGSGNFTSVEQAANSSNVQNTSIQEMDIVGDGCNYFGYLLWRNTTNGCVYAFERSIRGTASSAPVYDSTFVTYVVNSATNTKWYQQSLFLSGATVTAVRTLGATTLSLQTASLTLVTNNMTPVFPVFPIPGYVSNPMTVLVGLSATDTTEGTSITTTVYGATHTYLCSKQAIMGGFGNGVAGNWAVGLRFE